MADDDRGVGEPLNETTEGVTPYPPYGNAERQVGYSILVSYPHSHIDDMSSSHEEDLSSALVV